MYGRFQYFSSTVGVQNAGVQNVGVQNAGVQNAGVQNAGVQNAGVQNFEPLRQYTGGFDIFRVP